MQRERLFGTRPLLTLGGVWLASMILALPLLQLPLIHDDQALFRLVGSVLAEGGRLYRDIWDVKQPGIFWFYWLGESIRGGATGSGVHALFIAWLGATGVLAAVVTALALPGRRLWMLAPLLTIPFYTLRVNVYTTAQLEALMPLPILVVVACVTAAFDDRLRAGPAYLISGLMIGVVAIFKMLLAAIPAAVALVALLGLWRARGSRAFRVGATGLVAGTAAVLGGVIAGFAMAGTLDIFLWTLLIYPPAALGQVTMAPLSRAWLSIVAISSTTALLLPAAAAGVQAVRVPGLSQPVGRVALLCMTWPLVNVLVIVAQRMSWHTYHFAMLSWPLGILAVLGIGTALSRRRKAGAYLLLALSLLGLGVNGARSVTRDDTVTLALLERQRLERLPALKHSLDTGTCRSAFVFGGPGLLLAGGLRPVAEFTGQLAPYLLPEQWPRLEQVLQERLPAYLYVDAQYEAVIQRRSPLLWRWIPEHYRQLDTDDHGGRWLIRAQGAAGPCPDALSSVGRR